MNPANCQSSFLPRKSRKFIAASYFYLCAVTLLSLMLGASNVAYAQSVSVAAGGGPEGAEYRQTITASGFTSPVYTVTLSDDSAAPNWVTVEGAEVVLNPPFGTVEPAGATHQAFTFKVTATEGAATASGTFLFTLFPSSGPPAVVSGDSFFDTRHDVIAGDSTVLDAISHVTSNPAVSHSALTGDGNPTWVVNNNPSAGQFTVNPPATALGNHDISFKFCNQNTESCINLTLQLSVVPNPGITFITVWNTGSANETITFPGQGNYTIDWGDGTTGTGSTTDLADPTHTYADAGNHTITVSNSIARFNLYSSPSRNKLREVSQWGTARWISMENAFRGASNMRMSATDMPNLSGLTGIGGISLKDMFIEATVFNSDISGWNVAAVTDMENMFKDATAFNQNLGRWYIVPSDPGTYNGSSNLNVLTLSVQNAFLRRHNPVYALIDGDGDDDNNLFTLTGSTLSVINAIEIGSYNVRIGASGANTFFGTDNAVALTITNVVPLFTLDVDKKGGFDINDALMIARYALSIKGANLTASLTTVSHLTVVDNIKAGESSLALNVDGSTVFDINDALMIVRYALSIKGVNLTASLTTVSNETVTTNIERFLPK